MIGDFRIGKLHGSRRYLFFLFIFMLITSTLIYTQFMFMQPVYASPDLYQSTPKSHATDQLTFIAPHDDPTDAYDKDNATYVEFNYELAANKVGGYLEVIDFTKAGGTISRVDFKMKYSATAATKNGKYSIKFSLDGSTWTTLVAATGVAHSVPVEGCDVWADEPRPGGGSWTWTDISNIQFRVETTYKTAGGPPAGRFSFYEAWVTVHFTPPATPTVYVEPSSKVNLTLTPPAEKYSLTLRPNAEGTFDEWYEQGSFTSGSADYTNWDEATPNDSDYNWIDDEYWFQSSNLQDHTSETWSIAKVKVTARAKANQYSDDKLILMLVIDGTEYSGVTITNASTSWTEYTSTWGMNPDTMDQWTWSEIDALEAGVYTDSGDDAMWDTDLEIYVSQLYVEVFGPGIKFDIYVDYIADFWQWQFELYYNPDVLQGVYADEGNEYPVGVDPDGFLASGRGTLIIAPGPGWNNTLGKLWLTSANLLQKIGPVTGGGRIASFIMECGAGKGETDLYLGDLTAVYDVSTGYIQPIRGHGYFRNVDVADLPTASFTKTPQIPPDPLEGYNMTFDASASTPDGGTIVEFKWYFGANFPYDTVHEVYVNGTDPTFPRITRNYTARSPPGGVYNVTLTVKDNNGVVASAKDSFTVKAHDIAIVLTDIWDVAMPENETVTVGEIAKINVTIANQGDYNEVQINVSCYYQYPGGPVAFIGNQTGISVNAGQQVNATITWDTTGLTVTNTYYTVWANATPVDYEYGTTDNTGSSIGVYVKPSGVPEFPLGAAMEITLATVVIYLWWRSKRKRKPYETRPKTSVQTLKRI